MTHSVPRRRKNAILVRDIVVIGAAIGGVTAMANLSRSWALDLPVSVLVTLAVPEQPASTVMQIIRGYLPIPVRYAQHGEVPQLRHAYLSPPNRHLTVAPGGALALDDDAPCPVGRPSVDQLFASAAAVFGSRVIGIVLSGESREGAQGLRQIEAAGGVGIVQAPEDAVASRMPRNAIRNGDHSFCVKASEIAAIVERLVSNALVLGPGFDPSGKP